MDWIGLDLIWLGQQKWTHFQLCRTLPCCIWRCGGWEGRGLTGTWDIFFWGEREFPPPICVLVYSVWCFYDVQSLSASQILRTRSTMPSPSIASAAFSAEVWKWSKKLETWIRSRRSRSFHSEIVSSANLCGCYTALYCSTAAIVVNHFSNLCIMLMYGDNARPPITVDCLFILVDIFCDLCIMQMYCGTICAQATVVLCQPCGLLS